MQSPVHNVSHQEVGSVALPDEVFAAAANPGLLSRAVNAQRASWRAGTHCTKRRGEVRGGGAKPFKQKGTGRARQGSSRAPNHVGGGVAFGPRPRDYSTRLPRSARRAALRAALSERARDGQLMVLDAFALPAPSTRTAVDFLRGGRGGSALVVDADNGALKLSLRNLQAAKYLAAEAINVYDILRFERLIITQRALPAVVERARAQLAGADGSAAGEG